MKARSRTLCSAAAIAALLATAAGAAGESDSGVAPAEESSSGVAPAEESPNGVAPAVALEAEIRGELASLRDRIEHLEVLLGELTAMRQGGAPAATAASDVPAPVESASSAAVQEMPEGLASTGGPPLAITGLVDTYYTHNTNAPEDGTNTLYYTNPHARGFGVNQLKLELETTGAGPFGFRSDLWFGSGARLFREGLEPGPLADLLYVQQAYGYYRFGNGAQVDVGAFGTIAGLEVAESHGNWNYSRGILWAWNEPFSHVGTRLSAPLTDTLTGTVMLVNGFDNAFDQNSGKSYGLQGAWAPSDRGSTVLTWIHGPENAGTNDGWLRDLSWNASYQFSDRFEAMANMDLISATDPQGVTAMSWGMGGYLRFHLSDRVRIAQRYEFLDDQEGRSTGVSQTLMENTLTLEFQPVLDDPRFLTRLEYRRDWSDAAFFSCSTCSDGVSTSQNTFTIGMSWVFGPR